MSAGQVFWAGGPLDARQEERLRRLVDQLRRSGEEGTADAMARFLPENMGGWTPDELEMGAHVGPWLSVEGHREI